MFGPNPIPEQIHHRELRFMLMLNELERVFKWRFGLPDESEIIFLTGSGTLALEAVLASVTLEPCVAGLGEEFANRLQRSVDLVQLKYVTSNAVFWVQYETAAARLADEPAIPSDGLMVADCVSSFPYYDWPRNADIIVTVSGKQLGAPPGLGIIIVMRPDVWEHMAPANASYLSLNKWRERKWNDDQPAHTPAITIMYELRRRLYTFHTPTLQWEIDNRRAMVERAFPDCCGEGPVVNIPLISLDARAVERWGLYTHDNHAQLFLWTGSCSDYKKFCDLEGGQL